MVWFKRIIKVALILISTWSKVKMAPSTVPSKTLSERGTRAWQITTLGTITVRATFRRRCFPCSKARMEFSSWVSPG